MVPSVELILSKMDLAIVMPSCFQACCQLRSTFCVPAFQVNCARCGFFVIDRYGEAQVSIPIGSGATSANAPPAFQLSMPPQGTVDCLEPVGSQIWFARPTMM